ncbi:ATP-dependent RNA helicase SUV3 homolog, mitochondrial isoform X2 [Leptopilina heterotoma]|uniref:ATP-dependent RNA helicase SUV3 homolog, mitochondrial isoform X2 n=1 Tax=Leptopilina heterotoma TaxID=63436 RepID=UPI001CAA273D|nr:ATP-dependent RNA helicase SUV3 homolog, mitochondrial isoform X2 [Leptopilina heterotoma]
MIPAKRCISEILLRRNSFFSRTLLKRSARLSVLRIEHCRGKKTGDGNESYTSLFKPVPLKQTSDDINVGAELSGTLSTTEVQKILEKFRKQKDVETLSLEYGLDSHLQQQVHENFKQYCLQTKSLPVDLHVILSDIIQGAGHITDIFPYYIRHAKEIFPHIDCIEDLKKISDLRTPVNWYPLAREKKRKVIFHAGPTNSGKTYHALEKFKKSSSGLYCGPLKLLAVEVFNKCNDTGTPCDLITGEDKRFARGPDEPSSHVACTVEMANVSTPFEIVIIDEIQLMKDFGRGWAWTRALLGLCADEVHVCGEPGAVDLVQSLCDATGDTLEVRNYKRLTNLLVESEALTTLKNVRPGDCIVCFNKNDIYTVSRSIERIGKDVAVIYGSLPPGTKLAQAAKFNNPDHPCKILIATDAIGMGLNLHIRRIIFYSMVKPTVNGKGEKEMDVISVSSALQIAGRAGRFGTQWETGYVTTFKPQDLRTLKTIMNSAPESITKAGLHPTADQIEMYAYHLPDAPLSNLMDIFVSLSTVDDSLYFICDMNDFKYLADMIQHVNLPLRARYVFCCAPINRKLPFLCSMFLKYARQYSKNDVITAKWVQQNIGWPQTNPMNIQELMNLEAVFDILDLYLWLSYRFPDLFSDGDEIRRMQENLDSLIEESIIILTQLIKNSKKGIGSKESDVMTFAPVKGKVSESLIAKGQLSLDMLQELHKEWEESKKGSSKNLRNIVKDVLGTKRGRPKK